MKVNFSNKEALALAEQILSAPGRGSADLTPSVGMRPALIQWRANEDGTGETYQAPVWAVWVDDWHGFKDLAGFAIPLYRDYKRRGLI